MIAPVVTALAIILALLAYRLVLARETRRLRRRHEADTERFRRLGEEAVNEYRGGK